MPACNFFGHKDCCSLYAAAFRSAIERRNRYVIESAEICLRYVNYAVKEPVIARAFRPVAISRYDHSIISP